MELPIDHDAFAGRGLALRPAGLLRGPRLLIDGHETKRRQLKFTVRDNSGEACPIQLTRRRLDPIPEVHIGGDTVTVVRPLTWYEYVWMGLPIGLVVAGGVLGAFAGFAGMYVSARIFRSKLATPFKYASSALVSLSAALAYLVSAIAISG